MKKANLIDSFTEGENRTPQKKELKERITMQSYYQGQNTAEGTFVNLQNPTINVDNYRYQFKKTDNCIPYMLPKKAKKYFGKFLYK